MSHFAQSREIHLPWEIFEAKIPRLTRPRTTNQNSARAGKRACQQSVVVALLRFTIGLRFTIPRGRRHNKHNLHLHRRCATADSVASALRNDPMGVFFWILETTRLKSKCSRFCFPQLVGITRPYDFSMVAAKG